MATPKDDRGITPETISFRQVARIAGWTNQPPSLIGFEHSVCSGRFLELLTGAKPRELADVRCALRFSTQLPFPRACWQDAASLEKGLRSKGVAVPRDDIFVGAAALHHDVAVLALDPHFKLMRDKGRVPLELV